MAFVKSQCISILVESMSQILEPIFFEKSHGLMEFTEGLICGREERFEYSTLKRTSVGLITLLEKVIDEH